MKKLLFTLFLSIIFLSTYGQRSSGIVPSLGVIVNTPSPSNVVWVDTTTAGMSNWKLARFDSLKLKPWQLIWLTDTIYAKGDIRYAQLLGAYSNPTFVNSLSAAKVFGLSSVATTGDYNDLTNKPNLNLYYLASNPNGYISGITGPMVNAALGYVPYNGTINPNGYLTTITSSQINSALGYTPLKPSDTTGKWKSVSYTPSSSEITTSLGYTPVPNSRTITINGTAQDLTANRSWTLGDVFTSGSYGNPSWVTSLAWSKITGTPTTLSGYGITDGVTNSTLSGYATTSALTSGLSNKVDNTRTLTINGSTFDLSANRTWNVGTLVANDTVSLSNRINGKLNPSDTISLSNRINTKQNQLNGTGFVKASGSVISYDNSVYLTTETDPLFDTKFAGKSTTNLTEGTNLYWTATRSNNALTSSAINTAIGGTVLKSTDTTSLSNRINTVSASIPAQYNPTAGSGISITGTYPNQTISNTAPDQTLNLSSGTGISISGTYPSYTITNTSASPTFNNTVSRTLNSNYTISATKNARCYYTITLSVATPLLAGAATAQAFLEYSTNSGSTWIIVGDITNTQSVGLSVSVAITTPSNFVLCGEIPANALVRIRTNTTGTGAATYVRGQEILY